MNKRQFLQVLPLAALTATMMKVDNVEAQVHELKPEKKYLIIAPESMSLDDTQRLGKCLAREGVHGVICTGADLKVYELL